MYNRQRKSRAKRHQKNDEVPHGGKCQRLESPPPSPPLPLVAATGPEQVSEITDLYDDCLERIFMLLDLESLLNVTLSNKWLGPAANIVYKLKFDSFKVCLHNVIDSNPNAAPIVVNCEADAIIIRHFKVCLQFLRSFGSSVQVLEIHYGHSDSKRYDYVHEYVNQYCSESLDKIGFFFMPPVAIKNFTKPFANVHIIQMYSCDLSDQFLSFIKWFPNAFLMNIHGFGLKHCSIDMSPTQLKCLMMTLTDLRRGHILELHKCIGDVVKSSRKLYMLIIRTTIKMDISSLLKTIKQNRSAMKTAMLEDNVANDVETKRLGVRVIHPNDTKLEYFD